PPFTLEGQEVFITCSMGLVVNSPATTNPDDFLRDADVAMYEAKRQGKDRYTVFDPAMTARAWERLQMEIDLRHALEHDELRVFYQPIVDLASGRLRGVEALVRWQHPTRGLITPGQFIPMAEETGLIVALGQHVLQAACTQVRAWQRHYPDAGS